MPKATVNQSGARVLTNGNLRATIAFNHRTETFTVRVASSARFTSEADAETFAEQILTALDNDGLSDVEGTY